MKDAISRLSTWYERQCVDDWHEDHGLKIGTLDNPGWSIFIDLNGTSLQERPYEGVKIDRTDNDWLVTRRNEAVFEAFGGPMNLNEMIEAFLNWAD